MEGYVSDFYADGAKVGRFPVFEHGFESLALFKTLTAHAHLGELFPVNLLRVYPLKALFLLSCIIRRIDTGGVQHLLIGGTSGAWSLSESTRALATALSKGTLKKVSGARTKVNQRNRVC